ncbi:MULTISPECIES: thermonuclease family protein [unclassified Rhizobium]|uniref:thermonuclease family protein n=1 Tax=unclassified Rhizobium TaxID=2613769 RepID=UPI0007EAA000|nr:MULTISPECIES: thermonuclease family protein [unclassified Rhizobium]ANL12010.1 nuclease SNase-like protein [Rhizobium sp. N1341]ANM42855.1 nuclease SNase-like protein [Rhizobium sp. N741]
MPTVAAIVCFSAAACSPQQVIVIDGDTIVVQGEHIRLEGINAPELKGKCREESVRALRSRSRLMQLLAAGTVEIERDGFDKYRRTLAFVAVDGVAVGDVLMKEGLARKWVQQYSGQQEPWCQPDVGQALKTWN